MMTRAFIGCGLAFGLYRLLRRVVAIEIVREPSQPPRARPVDGDSSTTLPAWYREWIVAQACVRSRYDC